MILKLINNTATIKTYASGNVTLPANGTVTIAASLQLATATDGNLFSDVSQNNVSISDNVNTFVVNDGLVYLDRIVRVQVSINDSAGTAITSTLVGSKQSLDVNISQSVASLDNTGSGSISALNGTITANTQGCASLQFVIAGTWSATLTIQGTVDGVNWTVTQGDIDSTDTIASTLTVNSLVTIPCAAFTQVRLIATAYTSGTATIAYDSSVGASLIEVYSTNAISLQATVRLNDGSGNAIKSTTNQDLQVDDTTRAAGVDTVITMTGAAIEVKVGASRLTTRKYVLMNPTGNSCKWGFTSTSQSFDIFKNGFTFFPASASTPIWIIGPAGVTVEIGEV